MKKFSISFICILLVFLTGFSVVSELIGTRSNSPAGTKYMQTENLALKQKK